MIIWLSEMFPKQKCNRNGRYCQRPKHQKTQVICVSGSKYQRIIY